MNQLMHVNAEGFKELLCEMPNRELVVIYFGASQDVRNRIHAAISNRASTLLLEDYNELVKNPPDAQRIAEATKKFADVFTGLQLLRKVVVEDQVYTAPDYVPGRPDPKPVVNRDWTDSLMIATLIAVLLLASWKLIDLVRGLFS